MDERLEEVLEGREGNYILPFFWQHGEDGEVLKEEMRRIFESGIRAVCIESRPHPDFSGPGWWRDMDIILNEAKALEMKVWVLDDSHFPTGYANGWIRNKYPEKGKVHLTETHIDAYGPLHNAAFIIDRHLQEGDILLSVIASRKTGIGDAVEGTFVDLTDQITGGLLYWDIPEGPWRMFILYTTRNASCRLHYINPVDPDSVKVLIEAVYQPHYQRYKDEFGKTFAGFFSDEPEMGNTQGYNFDEIIGRKNMPLPWSSEIAGMLGKELGEGYVHLLPCLWYEAGSVTHRVRYAYMNIATRLYQRSFTQQIGAWCRERGIEYIGHIIEDCNAHTKLGCSTGHFFRSLRGQDMSGMDVVLQQILPGFDQPSYKWIAKDWGGEFFHYALAKLASSLGHIDPLMKGRTMCEIFGAYGWMEGLKLMKWLTDHMLVRGINRLVPHAFSPHPFPDPDCPPHFYAQGKNPQYRFQKILSDYTNRLCHLLDGGLHVAPTAVLYHAEAEWCGDCMEVQKPLKELLQRQIDCDILPSDVFEDAEYGPVGMKGGCFIVNEEAYRCLIMPYSQYIRGSVARFAAEARKGGVRVIFINDLPQGICDEENPDKCRSLMDGLKDCILVPLGSLAEYLLEQGIYDIRVSANYPYMRYYHYKRQKAHFYFFFNEHPYEQIAAFVDMPVFGQVRMYDAFNNLLGLKQYWHIDGNTRIKLELSPYESVMVVIDEEYEKNRIKDEAVYEESCEGQKSWVLKPETKWRVSLARAKEYPSFKFAVEIDQLTDMGGPNQFADFSGTFRYEAGLSWMESTMPVWLELGNVYETAEVWVNDIKAGVRICPPYRFQLKGLVQQGYNTLRIEVTNTLVREQRDSYSMNSPLEPVGLLGPISFKF